jgi:hypothetical protein
MVIAACMASASSALGWTSRGSPLFDSVHQMAIDNVLAKLVDPANLKILKEQQEVVDEYQKPIDSDQHSMTGVQQGQVFDEKLRKSYITKTEKFIRDNLNNSIQKRKVGTLPEAFSVLGRAIHALQDATSPVHEPFKPWRFDETLWSQFDHVWEEGVYPNDDFLADIRPLLEGTVLYAYDIYMENIKMPDRFFDSKGILQLPKVYRLKRK